MRVHDGTSSREGRRGIPVAPSRTLGWMAVVGKERKESVRPSTQVRTRKKVVWECRTTNEKQV